MPVTCRKIGKKFRIFGPNGRIEKTNKGNAVDGGGHSTRPSCGLQARAINASVENVRKPKRTKVVPGNPLKADPTRSKVLRDQFTRAITKRFNRLKSDIINLIVREDAFGLREPKNPFTIRNEIHNTRFAFQSDQAKVESFRTWLQTQFSVIVPPNAGQSLEDQWWTEFTEQGYRKGAGRAFDDTQRARRALATTPEQLSFFEGTKEQFLAQSFGRAESIEKIKLLAGRVFTELKGVTDSMAQSLTRELTQGLAQGDNPNVIARNINRSIGNIPIRRARAIARTECLTGDTLVDGAVVRAVFRRWYEGDLIEVITRSGSKFSATSNHPMLTENGWISAGLLNKGDNLICNNRQESSSSSRNKNVDRSPSTISEIFDSLGTISVTERVAGAKPDFHGDGREGYVDILRPNRELHIGSFSPIYKPVLNNIFTPTGFSGSSFCPCCGRLLPINKRVRSCSTSQSDTSFFESIFNKISVYSQFFTDFTRRLTSEIFLRNHFRSNLVPILVSNFASIPRIELGFGVSSGDTRLPENFSDLFLIGTNFGSNLSLSQSSEIEFDDVLSVTVRPFSGHVYNLETECGYFTIDSLYTGNTIRAHAEGQLDAMEQMGLEEVGVAVEWSTALDDRVCPLCSPMEGTIFKIKEARGIIPRHTN